MKLPKIIYILIVLILILLVVLIIKANFAKKDEPEVTPVPSVEILEVQPTPSLTPKAQLDAEIHRGEIIELKQREKPWLKTFSIVEEKYIVRYEYSTDSLEIVVYTKDGLPKYLEMELDAIRVEAERKLVEQGVDLSKEVVKLRLEEINE